MTDKTDKPEAVPCPFCKSAKIGIVEPKPNTMRIFCVDCSAQIIVCGNADLRERALSAWNTRLPAIDTEGLRAELLNIRDGLAERCDDRNHLKGYWAECLGDTISDYWPGRR